MRRLLLTALLLLPAPALAGGQEGPPPAAPRTAATAPVLRLTAPVGTTVYLITETVSRTEIESVEVQGEDAAELEAAVRGGLGAAGTQRTTGESSTRVQSRGADGSVTLRDTALIPLPDGREVALRVFQTVRPNGTRTGVRFEVDDPTLQQVFAGLNSEQFQRQFATNDPANNLYGFPLVPGQSRTATATVDMQALLTGLFGGLLGPEAADFPAVQASPMTARTTTTYRGLNAARQHVFETSSTFAPWSVQFGGGADSPEFRAELLSQGSRSTTSTLFRADGLTAGGTQSQTLRMRVTTTGPDGETMRVTFRVTTEATVRAR
ncbi:hypothetical protein L1280_002344 [Deinococcus sp. HSC-46F16]|uniref:hypothetical protein n=1 Tax=Deinococcus sp. HSC-46F16 TaxID=2910968 RepID=UPI00209FF840|nr:hypothetical protein [Deinococcus sp. HSC-46F16]MCP2015183.1 hypothetical protein [Deinococcus sp. HSC-46F16]